MPGSRISPFSWKNIASSSMPAAPGVLCFLAAIPYGSVAGWAHNIVILACAVFGVSVLLFYKPGTDAFPAEHVVFRIGPAAWCVLAALVAWIAFQLVPLPVSLLAKLQPLARDRYLSLFAPGSVTTIGLDRHNVLSAAAAWTAVALLAWVAARCSGSRPGASVLASAIALAGFAQALTGILNGPGAAPGDLPWNGRMTGTFRSSDAFGGFLAVTLPVTLGLVLHAVERFSRDAAQSGNDSAPFLAAILRRAPVRFLILSVALIIQWCAILMSASRAAIISTSFAQIMLVAWYGRLARRKENTRFLGAAAVAGSLVLMLGVGGAYAMLVSRFAELSSPGDTMSLVSRLHMWGAALLMFAVHPLGVGPGCFRVAFPTLQPPGFENFRLDFAHNDFIQVACELGLPGTVLLVLLAAVVARRMIRQAKLPADPDSWLKRAGAVAVVAGLLNCLAEFNLTSRPAVAAVFFTTLGLAWPFSGPQPSAAATASRAIAKYVRRALFVMLCGAIAIFAAFDGAASWLRDTAWASISGKTNPYFWLEAGNLAPETAMNRLRSAARIMPLEASADYRLALSRYKLLESEREQADNNAIRQSKRNDRAFVAQAVRVATAEREIEALRNAIPILDRAIARSPWNPDAYSWLAKCRARLLIEETDPKERAGILSSFHHDLNCALILAPNDKTVLLRLCEALAIVVRTGDGNSAPQADPAGLLKDLGVRALRLGGGSDRRVLLAWRLAGFDAAFILSGPPLPPDSLWHIYYLYDREEDAESCLACLQALRKAVTDPSAKVVSYVRKSPAQPGQHLEKLALEESKWRLRAADWPAYQAIRNDRANAFALRLEKKFAPDAVSPSVRLIMLRQHDQSAGLTVPLALEYCRSEATRGVPADASRRLAELSLTEQDNMYAHLEKFLESENAIKDHNYGMALVKARVDMYAGNHGEALQSMEELLGKPNLIPLAFRPRIRYFMAQCADRLGDSKRAASLLRESVSECPADPDPLSLLAGLNGADETLVTAGGRETTARELLAEITPPHRLGTTYLGGKAELTGIRVSERTISGGTVGETSVCSYWRFNGTVPSDLEILVMFVDETGNTMAARRKAFGAFEPLQFCAGSPMIGSVIALDHVFPMPCINELRLRIVLQRTSTGTLKSDEGLPSIEIWNPGLLCESQVRAE